jgi:hypothetical protein
MLIPYMIQTPIGTWSLDPKLKEIGLYQLEQICDAVESFSLAVLTRVLGWNYAECEVLIANVRRDFRNKKNHLYSVRHFVYGRKPERIT